MTAKRYIFAFAILFSIFVSSCTDNNTETPNTPTPVEITLSVTPESLSLNSYGDAVTLEVSTDAEAWDHVNATSWLAIHRDGNTLTISARENESEDIRKGSIRIIATTGNSRAEKEIPVEQASRDASSDVTSLFECPVFEQIVLTNFDFNGDGKISAEEAAKVTDMVLTYEDEDTREPNTSLKGNEMFVNLVNLDCDLNAIEKLDLSGLEKLEYVDCCYNVITELNVTGCKALKWLYAYSNKIEKLYVTGCDNLSFLQAYNNKITTLDVSGFPELVYLDLRINNLKDIKFDNCPKLQIAAIGTNDIISLNLEGLPELITLGCYENSITSLDLSTLPKLNMLECYANNISTLDLSKNKMLTAITCQRNLLTELNIEGCTLLKKLDCSNNYLTGTLNVNAYPELSYLHCGGNGYTAVEANSCTKMTDLECANTQITTLEVSALTLLESLVANDCELTTMDCSNNLNLDALYLQGNPLEVLYLQEGQSIVDLKLDNHDVISYK